ncbi:hypothetical protein AB0L44_32855 [Nonomuraea wenchangensis]|uniref:hypothetical protein n=1 Tax=Nonomuraea wenchangensis TaxID=568860 RepID=UPI0034399C55
MLGHLGVGLLGINLLGNLGDAAGGAVLSVLASCGVTEQETAIADAVGGEPVFVAVQLMVLAGMLGFVLLPVGQLLARTVHRAVPALILVALVSFFLPVSEGVGGVLLGWGWARPAPLSCAAGPSRPRGRLTAEGRTRTPPSRVQKTTPSPTATPRAAGPRRRAPIRCAAAGGASESRSRPRPRAR